MTDKTFFIAGTDTGVGKTVVSCALLRTAQAQGLSTLGLKPVAAGCHQIDGQWRNDDALLLQNHSSVNVPYHDINPFNLKPAIAPHIAAQQEGVELAASALAHHCQTVIDNNRCAFRLIEGAGGWMVPLNDSETFADLVQLLNVPVILVVGVKLGCINHALLSSHAIQQRGLTLQAWVANCIDPHASVVAENIQYLKEHISAPLLGTIPFQTTVDIENAGDYLNIDLLLDE